MSFDVAAEAYDAFMGRYSSRLAPWMADFAGVRGGQSVLDVGCGPGALTAELIRRVGSGQVSAADPQARFVQAAATRNPSATVVQASAEALPFSDHTFDVTLAQLVVHFMADPVAGLTEMARVTKVGGVVAACVWDYAGDRSPLSTFWTAARELDPDLTDESQLVGAHEGDLARLLGEIGLVDVRETALEGRLEHASFEEWWKPYENVVGPAGTYLAGLSETARRKLRERCREKLGDGPSTVTFDAWAARGAVPARAAAPHPAGG